MSKRTRSRQSIKQTRRRKTRRFEALEDRRMLAAGLIRDLVDLNTAPAPNDGIAIGNTAYFANEDINGNELWKSDGTVAGTLPVKDIFEGASSSNPSDFVPLGNNAAFLARSFDVPNDFSYDSVWITDGTEAGTKPLKEGFGTDEAPIVVDGTLFFSGQDQSSFDSWSLFQFDPATDVTSLVQDDFDSDPLRGEVGAAGGKLFFTFADDDGGEELWVSSGGESGANLVKDIQVGGTYYGNYGSYPSDFTAAGGLLYFTAEREDIGRELWVSDGTIDGTILLKDIFEGLDPGYYSDTGYSSSPTSLTASGDSLFFVAEDGTGRHLWTTSGTPGSTLKLSDEATSVSELTDVGGTLFFAADSDVTGTELWSSDGTEGGTSVVIDLVPSPTGEYGSYYSSSPRTLSEYNGQLLFTVSNELGEQALFGSDGTAAGTLPISDLGGSSQTRTIVGNAAGFQFFTLEDSTMALWRTDGTGGGTLLVQDNIGGDYYDLGETFLGDDFLFFTEPNQPDLFVTEGDAGDTTALTANFFSDDSNPKFAFEALNQLVFRTDDAVWISDGTELGTVKLADHTLNYGFGYSQGRTPQFLGADLGNGTFVFAGDAVTLDENGDEEYLGNELWISDGTPENTTILKDLRSGYTGSSPFGFRRVGDEVYFTAGADEVFGDALWRTDGTAEGTEIISETADGSIFFYHGDKVAVGDRLYFVAVGGDISEPHLWTTSADSTVVEQVLDVTTGGVIRQPDRMVNFDGKLVLTGGGNPWVVDGNEATLLSTNVVDGDFEPFDGELYFASGSDEIWKTDGEVIGTERVVDLTETDYYYSDPNDLTAVGDRLFFTARQDAENFEDQRTLWTLQDGVAASLIDINPDDEFESPKYLTSYQDRLIFVADDGVTGEDLWISDGTIGGTELFKDISPRLGQASLSPTSSRTNSFTVIDEQVFFVANDGVTGAEPWRATLPIVEVDAESFSGVEASEVTATGRFRFTETLDADFGEVTDNGDDTWTWTGTLPDGPATQTVTLTATDEDGFAATASFELVINNVAPTLTLVGDSSVDEGSIYELDLSDVFDPGQDTISSWIVDWGDGSVDTYDEGGVVTHVYPDGNITNRIRVSLVDEDGTYLNIASKFVDVVNVRPQIALSGESSVVEGSPYTLTLGEITDPGNDRVTQWTVDWGDGNSDTYGSGGDVTHVYADGDFSALISVSLQDEDGVHSDVNTLSVDIINDAPTIEISGPDFVLEGETYLLTLGEITDAGDDTVTQWIVEWGDGNMDTFTSGGVKEYVYGDGFGAYSITVSLTDDDGFYENAGSTEVLVDNVEPTLSITGASEVVEGETYTLTLGEINDPGDDLVQTWFVDWGDGQTETFFLDNEGGDVDHVYADGLSFVMIVVGVEDEDGFFPDLATLELAVTNRPPTIDISGPATINEGDTYSLTLGDIVDSGDDTVTAWTVDWGDGTTDTYFSGGVVEHVYADGDSTATISVSLEDEDQFYFDVASTTVEILNVAPQIALSGESSVVEGSPYTLTLGEITDPGNDTVTQWTVDWGDGNSDTYTEGGDVTHVYADGDLSALITVGLQDEDDTYPFSGTVAIEVLNDVPTIDISGPATSVEGSTYSLTLGEIIDAGDDTVSAIVVNWGDGQTDIYTEVGDVDHVYRFGDFSAVITVTIVNEDGNFLSPQTLAVEVANAPPTIELGSDITISGSGEVTFVRQGLLVNDPGPFDAHTITVDYGDGSEVETFTVDQDERFDLNHVYETAGIFTVTVTVDDGDGGVATDTLNVTADVSFGFSLGDVARGVAVADDATGTGYIMYSEQAVQERFTARPPRLAARQLIAVRDDGGQWQYNNNVTWIDFTPVDGDRLLAAVDFSNDTIATLKGQEGEIAGIASGYTSGDLDVFANRYNGRFGRGEFTVSGRHFVVGGSGQTRGVGPLNSGIAVQEAATGTGFLLFSEQSVHDRFADSAPNGPRPANADHFIAVQFVDGQWAYNNDRGWFSFAPAGSDRLLAALDFDNDTATSLEGSVAVVDGIIAGYPIGDLVFTANEYGGASNVGEFSVSGTYFENRFPGVFDIGELNFGVTAQDDATGTGYLMYTSEDVQSRFAANRTPFAHSSNLIMVRFEGGVWQYDNNTAWVEFTPTVTDRLLADVDFDADTIDGLPIDFDGELPPIEGIEVGYVDGDLAFFANQYKGRANPGDFEVTGTFFTTDVVPDLPFIGGPEGPGDTPPIALAMSTRLDVTGEGDVTARDALQIVNHLGTQVAEGESVLPTQRADQIDRLDVSGDDKVTALDALLVINALAKQEFATAPLANNPFAIGLDADDVDDVFAGDSDDWEEPSLF